jgi:glycine/D-amino acid oxidase-like deaminating enzyme
MILFLNFLALFKNFKKNSNFATQKFNNMKSQHFVVIGAGAFGGWTALMLLRSGFRVTLIEARTAGNSLSSSGDETRVTRTMYGHDRIYSEMARRAMHLWQTYEPDFKTKIFYPISVLGLMGQDDSRWRNSKPVLDALNISYQEMSSNEAAKRYPHIHFNDIQYAAVENSAGYLLARMGCHVVKERFVAEGGTFITASAQPALIQNAEMQYITLSDGSTYHGDQYIFACGPWLHKLFPEVIGNLVNPTKQDIFYFSVPKGSDIIEKTPIWMDFSSIWENTMIYGIPASGSDAAGRGFKIAEDVSGIDFDPDTDDRIVSPKQLQKMKQFMGHRFPSMKGQPIAEMRVCQYENTPDAHLIMDVHPEASNVWLIGGGSGHGYKHGAAIGEMMAQYFKQNIELPDTFKLNRFKNLKEKVERR